MKHGAVHSVIHLHKMVLINLIGWGHNLMLLYVVEATRYENKDEMFPMFPTVL